MTVSVTLLDSITVASLDTGSFDDGSQAVSEACRLSDPGSE